MPRKSIRERLDQLDRELLSPERYIAAKLTVISHAGEELFTVGGCWDRVLGRYVERECAARVFRLEKSQDEIGRAIGKYLRQRLAGDDERVACLMAIGNRGGGKTIILGGVLIVALALAIPGAYQMGVSITAKQNKEIKWSMAAVAAPEWFVGDVDDPRDPHTELITGARIAWRTSRNSKAMREAGLPYEHVFINEGQDQDQGVFVNGLGAVRRGGLVSIATNPPREDLGDWVAILYTGLEAGLNDGASYVLDARDNQSRGVSHATLGKISRLLRLVNPDAADADAEGLIKLSGDVGYPGFSKLDRVDENGKWVRGHIGVPPEVGWVDVTRELTAQHTGSSSGFDYVAGGDFQTEPGSCAPVGKLFRLPDGQVVLWIREFVATRGTEADLTLALNERGYFPGSVDYDGKPAASLMLVGDATGARQNAEHRRRDPYSFTRLRADGWTVLPPAFYGPKRTPWNPLIPDSRKQMKALFSTGAIMLSPACLEGVSGFPALAESFLRVKVNSAGKFDKKGHFTHGADGVRYICWRFLPRAQAPRPQGIDTNTFDAIRGIRILTSG